MNFPWKQFCEIFLKYLFAYLLPRFFYFTHFHFNNKILSLKDYINDSNDTTFSL